MASAAEGEKYDRTTARLQGGLALLPALSFIGQLYFSIGDGTFTLMRHHPTVMWVDWLLVPFNYLAARVIDWRRGAAMYWIWAISAGLVIATHALWQVQGSDPGHMITKTGVVLGAGWVHVAFSIAEMPILVAFVFCRDRGAPTLGATIFGCCYFVAMGISGYAIHHGVLLTDACTAGAGLIFILFPVVKKALTRPATAH